MAGKIVDDFEGTIKNEMDNFQKFNDIGISVLTENIGCLKKSIGKLGNLNDKDMIERVEIDASRLLTICKDEIEAKIQLCDIEESRIDSFKELVENLAKSIDLFATIITPKDINNEIVNGEELRNSLRDVQHWADKLLEFLKDLRNRRKFQFEKNFRDECENMKTRLVEAENRESDIKEQLRKSVDEIKFLKDELNKKPVTLIKKSFVDGIEHLYKYKDIANPKQYAFVVSIVFMILFLYLSSSSRIRDSKLSEVLETVEKLAYTQEANHYSLYYNTFSKSHYTINVIPKKDGIPVYLETVYIADLSWNIYKKWEKNVLKVWASPNWEESDPNWNCIVRSEFNVFSQFATDKYLAQSKASLLTSLSKNVEHEIPMANLTELIKDNTVLIELRLWLLSSAGIPTAESTFSKVSSQSATGFLTHTFSNVSKLEDNKLMTSETITIGTYSWQLGIRLQGVVVIGSKQFLQLEFSPCTAKLEIRVMDHSRKVPVHSETVVARFGLEQPEYVHENLNWEKIMRERKKFMNNDEITIQIIITSFRDFKIVDLW